MEYPEINITIEEQQAAEIEMQVSAGETVAAPVDNTLTVSGMAADAKATGDLIRQQTGIIAAMEEDMGSGIGNGGGLSRTTKNALAAFFTQMAALIPQLAFTGASHNGAAAVSAANAAVSALETTAAVVTLSSISAVFNPNGAAITTENSLDGLKQYLTVTAAYDDGSTATVSGNDYALSGTLAAGTSTITVSYGGKTATFSVTVTAVTLSSITAVYNGAGHTVYAGDTLDTLKPYLTVTATYSDGSTANVSSSSYSLSGTLAAGASTITVSYGGKTTTFEAIVSAPITYTPQVLRSGYAATGVRFHDDNVSINFSNGDYVEAQIDGTTCSQDNENIFAVGSSIAAFDEAVAYLFFRRIQNDVYKLLVRVKDVESSVAVDKWVSVSDWSNVMIQISADGVKVDGTSVSGITSANIANINSKGSYSIGAMCSKLTTATYDHITVFRRN